MSDVSRFSSLLGAARRGTSACAVALRGAGHARGGVHPARRHAVDHGRRHDLRRLHLSRIAKVTDVDGNSVTMTQFQVPAATSTSRATSTTTLRSESRPDITREAGVGSSLNGSYTFRLKYAFAQFNFDDWMTRGSWARFGLQQTPYVDYSEGIYRYRFQGTTFAEREGFLTSSDNGASFHYNFPKNFGDFHTGFYNGEGYSKTELNNTKAFQIRGSLRPIPKGSVISRPPVHRLLRCRCLRQQRRQARAGYSPRRSSTPTSTGRSSTSPRRIRPRRQSSRPTGRAGRSG